MPGGPLAWIDVSAWIMVIQCAFAQVCCWASMAFETEFLMYFEELNWTIMFVQNTVISLMFFFTGGALADDPRFVLVYMNLVFGAGYIPF